MDLWMQSNYVRSVVTGMIVGAVCLSIAGVVGTTIAFVVGGTQAGFLLYIVPPVLIACFTGIVLLVLRKDAAAMRKLAAEEALAAKKD